MRSQYVDSVIYNGGIDKKSYLNRLPVLQYLSVKKEIIFENTMTFFVGENGSGKSTLIEAIAVGMGFNAEGGSKNFNFSTRKTTYELSDCLTIAKSTFYKDGYFLRSESFYNVASNIEELEVTGYGERSLHEQSHGESFLALFQNRFRGNGLYILDEPESALSPLRQMTLLAEIHRLIEHNSQFIIATHSPILLAYPNATILEFSETGIEKVEYTKCQHFNIYKQFFDNPQRMIKYLLED
ncbi:MAG: AAA family ATPase [Peptococcaceae bacterium]|nr:AAA family ATPase [Peptococcaceae bacterium]